MGQKGEATKQRILDTARILFWKNNYHGITVDQIVAAASVNKASFYNYFSSKEDLALETIQANFTATVEYVYADSFATSKNPIKRLESIYKKVYTTHKEVIDSEKKSPGCPFVNIGMELAFENEAIRVAVDNILCKLYDYWAEIYTDALAAGLSNVHVAEKQMGKRLHMVMNGAMVSSRIHKNPKDILDAIVIAKAVLGIQQD